VTARQAAGEITKARRRPRGAVRDGLIAAGLALARAGGPDAVVLREATQMVGVVPNAARSTCSSIAWLPVRPVTASHNALDSRSSTEVWPASSISG
jgi:hypothetical protein